MNFSTKKDFSHDFPWGNWIFAYNIIGPILDDSLLLLILHIHETKQLNVANCKCIYCTLQNFLIRVFTILKKSVHNQLIRKLIGFCKISLHLNPVVRVRIRLQGLEMNFTYTIFWHGQFFPCTPCSLLWVD